MTSPRISPDYTTASMGFVACVLRAAGLENRIPEPQRVPVRPAGVRQRDGEVVAYGGSSLPQFEHMNGMLSTWFGEPKMKENGVGDYLIGRSYTYKNGLSLVYMTERDSGITMGFPKKILPELAQKWEEAHAQQATLPSEGRGR